MAKQLTIRGVPDEVERRLEIISREKQQSIKATVVGCLESAVGSEQRRAGLSRYATWPNAIAWSVNVPSPSSDRSTMPTGAADQQRFTRLCSSGEFD
jgi:plasmid stability protein